MRLLVVLELKNFTQAKFGLGQKNSVSVIKFQFKPEKLGLSRKIGLTQINSV